MSTPPRPLRGAPQRPRSLATRLATSFAVAAFLLVAGVVWLQDRALVSSLATEDDQFLRERLGDVAKRLNRATAVAENELPSGVEGIGVRRWDGTCRLVLAIGVDSRLPETPCPHQVQSSDGSSVVLRTIRGDDDAEWRVATTAGPGEGWLEVLLETSRDRAVVARSRTRAAALLTGALLLAAALGYLLARRGLRPLTALQERVERIDATSLDTTLGGADHPAEIAALTESFDRMLGRLQAAFDALSLRSAELAHELRTPLHVLRQQAEVALRTPRSPAEYRDLLASSLEELVRLQRMADDMLFLARAADPRMRANRTRLSVADEVADVASFLEALADEGGVRLQLHVPEGLAIEADRMLLRRALVNLLVNALRHTPVGGEVCVRAELEEREERPTAVRLVIEDTGSGIPAAVLSRVFDPFVRGAAEEAESARSAATAPPRAGAGLGLAIVRGIAELHRGSVELENREGGGTRVVLTLPTS
ncbi:MAG TPA: heavy metal sensor histidine kinase [Thermoanaerobaculia bacterium]|nr:heavy metal sensor histidine kinase [Thermoanaerobaculia bacterium]